MFLKTKLKPRAKALLQCGALRGVISRRTMCVLSYSYQYLQQSKIPTMHFQKSLPRLPIPELEKTCERYLAAQKPLLSNDEYNDTMKVVEHFRQNEGRKLHEELRKNDILHSDTSYISKPWFDLYLKDRIPLPVNYNPFLAFNQSKQPENNSQIVRASNMLISSLRFLKSLRRNILNPEVYHLNPVKSDTDVFRIITRLLPPSLSWYGAYLFKAFPLDMSQFSNLFGSTRIPRLNRDVLYKDDKAKHVLVIRRGRLFAFDVLDRNGNIKSPEDLYTCLRYILRKDVERNAKSVALLTTENRDNWARSREHLVSLSKENADAMKVIDSALFVMCLDDEEVNYEPLKLMKSFLHGDGCNRWFDKSFNLIISKDGVAALNFEHSWGDGVAVLRYFQDVYKDTNKNLFVDSRTMTSWIDPKTEVKELTFAIDDKISSDLDAARERFEGVCNALGYDFVVCPKFGKTQCKVAEVSPDSVMQLAFQVAYHKAYGNFVGTYESCSTAAFKHGRTETVRPCTVATKKFALNINGKNRPSRAELIAMMKECSSVHGNLTKEAAMGQGFDRHLFGLKDLGVQSGLEVPDFYKHEAYRKLNYNIISTSTLSSDALLIGGFGPVVEDGFGIAYRITKSECGASITSYPAHRNGAQFADALESTLNQFTDVLCGS